MKINHSPISNAYDVSSLILKYHIKNNIEIDLLKLLKLLYICFGCHSAIKEQYLFDERIEAWELGPVIPDIYYYIRYYADYLNNYKLGEVKSQKVNSNITIEDNLTEIYKTVSEVCNVYKTHSSSAMVRVTHAKDSPWDKIYDGTPSKEIPKDDIVNHYTKLIYAE